MKKIMLQTRDLFDYGIKAKRENINTKEVTVTEKAALEAHFRGSLYRGYYSGFEITTPRRTYQIFKVYTGIFKVVVYERSNKRDTSRPIDTYYLR